MKCAHLLIPLLLFSFLPLRGQVFPWPVAQYFYGGVQDEIPYKIAQSKDGHLWIAGEVLDKPGNCPKAWLIKVDTLGNLLREIRMPDEPCGNIRDLVFLEDGGLICVGSGLQVDEMDYPHLSRGDVRAFRVDANGKLVWTKYFGGNNHDFGMAIAKGIFGEFFISGGTHSYDGDVGDSYGMGDAWTLIIDQHGELEESILFGGKQNEWFYDIQPLEEEGFILTGFSNSQIFGQQNRSSMGTGFALRFNKFGGLTWKTGFPSTYGSQLSTIAINSENSILIGGTLSHPSFGKDLYWIFLDEQGNMLSEKRIPYPNDEYVSVIKSYKRSSFLLGGYSIPRPGIRLGQVPYLKGQDDPWLMRLDENGSVVWRGTFGSKGNERIRDLVSTKTGTIYTIGERSRNGNRDVWMQRIEELPCSLVQVGIYFRSKKGQIQANEPTRFRARTNYGDSFLWDFGDGTSSSEKEPLKTYDFPGKYEVSLTVFANENCKQIVSLPKGVIVN